MKDKTQIQPEKLLQSLISIQRRYAYIPNGEITDLADQTGLSEAHIRAVVDFYAFLHLSSRGHFDIRFSNSITDQMLGSLPLFRQLCDRLQIQADQPREDGRVTVDTTSCTGMCDQGPALLVNGRAITQLDEARIEQIANLVEADLPLDQWPQAFFLVDNQIRRSDILLQQQSGQGQALRALSEKGRVATLETIQTSGLRGRGGAGFETARKWSMCREAPAEPRYVVCNADEGEPGTFKDRVLLQSYADAVIEGMTVCARIVGAQQGLIYLRGEYFYLLADLHAALAQRRQAGLLGQQILGQTDWHFDIEIHLGAGAYICGEESALIESLEGKRGIPRNRPPFPVTNGYQNQPTVVNNVETFMAAAGITAQGADWFRSRGTAESTGTKLLSISGDCPYPGIYEVPFGVTIAEILADCGAENPMAVQVSGAAGQSLPASQFHRRLGFEDVSTGGSFMVFNSQRDLLDMVQNFAHFFVHESCGFCTPCRVGGSLLSQLVDKLHAGRASQHDLNEIRDITEIMQSSSHCGLGQSAPNSVLSTLAHFPEAYQRCLRESDYTPSFDLDAALSQSRQLTGRDDSGAHLKEEA